MPILRGDAGISSSLSVTINLFIYYGGGRNVPSHIPNILFQWGYFLGLLHGSFDHSCSATEFVFKLVGE